MHSDDGQERRQEDFGRQIDTVNGGTTCRRRGEPSSHSATGAAFICLSPSARGRPGVGNGQVGAAAIQAAGTTTQPDARGAKGLRLRNDVSDSLVHIMEDIKEWPKVAADPSWNEKLE